MTQLIVSGELVSHLGRGGGLDPHVTHKSKWIPGSSKIWMQENETIKVTAAAMRELWWSSRYKRKHW